MKMSAGLCTVEKMKNECKPFVQMKQSDTRSQSPTHPSVLLHTSAVRGWHLSQHSLGSGPVSHTFRADKHIHTHSDIFVIFKTCYDSLQRSLLTLAIVFDGLPDRAGGIATGKGK